MVNVTDAQIQMFESSMDCFYPLTACASAFEPSLDGRPPRAKKSSKKTIGTRKDRKDSRRKSRDDRVKETEQPTERARSNSKERPPQKKAADKQIEGKTLKKRLGAAYKRSSESVVTKETGTLFSDKGLDEAVNQSADTYTTDSISGTSSSEDISSSCDSNESPELVDESLTARLRNTLIDTRSISTEDVEKKPHNGSFSWFSMASAGPSTQAPLSPTDSVGAVKKSIRSKFDYIRKSQRFANPFPDPPSDRSMMSSHSIIADEAGSLLKRGYRYNISKKVEMQARKNELVKQILKQRHMVSRPGYDP